MEPFAQSSRPPMNRRRLVLIALAAALFSIWFFNLIPEMQSVPTGTLADTPDGIESEEFLDLLSQAPEQTDSTDDVLQLDHAEVTGTDSHAELSDEEQLLMALAAQSEPEMAQGNRFNSEPSLSSGMESEFGPRRPVVRQASFETSESNSLDAQVLKPEVATALRQIDNHIAQDNILDAHAELSRLYWKKPDLRPLFMGRLTKTSAQIYANSTRHFLDPYMVQPGDSLESIGRRYNVPWTYLALLNRIKPEQLQAGQKIKVLTGPFGAVVDLDERTLTIHSHGWFVRQYRVGIAEAHQSTTGSFTVQTIKSDPAWRSPAGDYYESGEPANPLGSIWIGLDGDIGIHGSSNPAVVGTIAVSGCIHLRDADIKELTHLLTHGSPVTIRR